MQLSSFTHVWWCVGQQLYLGGYNENSVFEMVLGLWDTLIMMDKLYEAIFMLFYLVLFFLHFIPNPQLLQLFRRMLHHCLWTTTLSISSAVSNDWIVISAWTAPLRHFFLFLGAMSMCLCWVFVLWFVYIDMYIFNASLLLLYFLLLLLSTVL